MRYNPITGEMELQHQQDPSSRPRKSAPSYREPGGGNQPTNQKEAALTSANKKLAEKNARLKAEREQLNSDIKALKAEKRALISSIEALTEELANLYSEAKEARH